MSAKPAKIRVQLSDADRRLICELAKSNRDLSHEKLTKLAAERLGKDLKRPTVTLVLQQSERWLKCTDSSASKSIKHRAPQHEKLEAALIEWFGHMRANSLLKMRTPCKDSLTKWPRCWILVSITAASRTSHHISQLHRAKSAMDDLQQ